MQRCVPRNTIQAEPRNTINGYKTTNSAASHIPGITHSRTYMLLFNSHEFLNGNVTFL
jgi:hypothetical protein